VASVIGAGPWLSGEGRRERGRRDSDRRGSRSKPNVDHLIESDIIPRMLVAHATYAAAMSPGSGCITEADLESFAPLAVTLEAHDLLAEVEAFMRRGIPVEQIFIELLAPAARKLGEDWTADRLDFLDVTMALWRLQEVLREVAARHPPMPSGGSPRSAIFSPFPGDQHSFGTAMLEECFSRAGWDSQLLIAPSRALLLEHVAAKSFDVFGLTVSCDAHIAPLPSLLTAVRNVSQNPQICLLVGGRVLLEDPDLARRAGADGTAATAVDALALADRLLADSLHVAFA